MAGKFAMVELTIGGAALDVTAHLQEFAYEEPGMGASKGQVVLFDYDWDFVDRLLQKVGSQQKVQFRFGFRGHMSTVCTLLLVSYQPAFTPQGATITIDLLDASSVKANMDVQTKAWPSKTYPRISDIVQAIAVRNGWQCVIEPTANHERDFRQSKTTDVQFIKQQLLKQAKNPKGASGYFCNMRGTSQNSATVLHFHTPTYRLDGKSLDVYRTYSFARDLEGTVLSFTPIDQTLALTAMGGGKTQFESYNQKKKKRVVVKTDPATDPTTQLIGPGSIPKSKAELERYISLPLTTEAELKNYAAFRKTYLNVFRAAASMQIIGDPYIHPMDIIRVNIVMRSGLPHPAFSGRWLVKSVSHKITAGSYLTDLELIRDSVGAAADNVKAQGKKVVTKDTPSTLVHEDKIIKPVWSVH